ncbi:hypothetical protein IMG5_129652 [Ichthyophthirius multifiliis]|uniref:Penicillin amidase family protein n=1 Tax=Ichthyophthirius multifiliis TaxID=5932 RepID=G0QW67_ICHMU|nr:hypothetical protein IMG5_129652 [Ichthyophthirius multifiliis]EGR30548.1 hypothetical protein IMG5_129652 [Ichthyophthirius multifiliis]|eukprot:XP_004032135.1 hypothetical protein IMG5_129652 [Ichthyophthirius multifiliis]
MNTQLFSKIKNFILGLFFVILIAVIIILYYWSPQYSGEIIHNYNYQNVYIYRDKNGIPHIKAQNLQSSFFGLGYVHCQDRLWNMDIYRRLASGKMSELFGNSTLEMDIMFLELGLNRAAKNIISQISPETIINLQAYTTGINECSQKMNVLPLEYQITRTKFVQWELLDSLYIMKLLSFQLTLDWQFELIREKLKIIYGRDVAGKMFAGEDLFDEYTIMNDDELKKQNLFEEEENQNQKQQKHSLTSSQIKAILNTGIVDYLIEPRGSNAWVIHGNHTSTGKPIVANDPHLDNSIPSIWYQALISYDSHVIQGGSMPGIGLILSGMTNYVAWSVTTSYSDSSDLYLEKLNQEKTEYFYEGEWRKLNIIQETIKIKGVEEKFQLLIRNTHRGPILSTPNLKKLNIEYKEELDLSFSWAASGVIDTNFDAIINIYHANSLNQVVNSLKMISSAYLAVNFGTVDNDIGFIGTGRHPIRKFNNQGAFLKNGTTADSDWLRYNNENEIPLLINPQKGYIITANNKISSNNIKNYLSQSISTTARGMRINQIIEQYIKNGTKISPEHVQDMQNDVKDAYAEKVLPFLIDLYEKNKKKFLQKEDLTQCDAMINVLKKWDSNVEVNSVGSSIYYSIDHFISKKLIPQYSENQQEKQKVTHSFVFDHFKLNSIVRWAQGKELDSIWCGLQKEKDNNQCIFLFIQSVLDAKNYLQKKLGGQINDWKYGKLHSHRHPHVPFSKTNLWPIFERSWESKGSKHTIHLSLPNLKNDNWEGLRGGNYKMIASLDQQNSNSYYIIDTGISGYPFSKHYTDQLKIYKNGQYLVMDRQDFEKYENVLVLKQSEQFKNSNKGKKKDF